MSMVIVAHHINFMWQFAMSIGNWIFRKIMTARDWKSTKFVVLHFDLRRSEFAMARDSTRYVGFQGQYFFWQCHICIVDPQERDSGAKSERVDKNSQKFWNVGAGSM
jgi:hypothetical protein